MHRAILWIIFVLIMPLVSASHIFINTDSLSEGDAEVYQTDNGFYIVQLLVVSDSQKTVKFKVNNELSDNLQIGQSYEFEDNSVIILREVLVQESGRDIAEYYFYGSGVDPIPVNININKFDIEKCNFDSECQENETNCCYDCGCEPEYKCENNKCIKKEGCTSDEECDDERACTQDSCIDKKCSYNTAEGCEFEDICLEYGTIKEIDSIQSYCLDDIWNSQKERDKSCKNDFECLNGTCKDNKCHKRSFKGIYISIIIVLLIILVHYSFKRFKIVKRIKTYLFWR